MIRYAFTMIELIFVIIILGILAAVAIPKLSATRDDASISSTVQAIKASMVEITSYVTAKDVIDDDLSVMSNVLAGLSHRSIADITTARTAVIKAGKTSNCATIEVVNSGRDENLTLQFGASTDPVCLGVQSKLSENNTQIKGRTIVH